MLTTIVTTNSSTIYPYIGEYIRDGGIVLVLFSSERTGIALYVTDPHAPYTGGHYSDEWMEDKFGLFKGSIILKNEF